MFCNTGSILFILAVSGASARAQSPDALKFFEGKVRPLLVQQCQECHGAQKHKGGLRLDNLPYILQGGEQGAAIVPHKPEESLLIKAVEYADKDMQMPPDGKMSARDIETLKQWIAMGAPWPEAEAASARLARKPGQITDEDRRWWAFQPVAQPKVPVLTGTVTPIDAFVRAKLMENKLAPSRQASPAELIRRVTLDLTGLPPTPERVAQFIADCANEPNREPGTKNQEPITSAYEALVDELLASPRYGQRAAQQWLDLVRYAESDGYRLDSYRPNVWPYRDYVIGAFNSDKPYGEFMREQIAGDEIAPDDPSRFIATAFLRHSIYEYNQRDAEGQWRLIINEVTDVTADVFLGMSVQCAQCHDHKFDPILQKDYYRLQAFLNNITWPEDKPLATEAQQREHAARLKAWQDAAAAPRKIIDDIIEPRIQRAQTSAMKKFPEEVQAMWQKPRDQRTPYEEQIVQLAWRQAEYERVRFKEEKMKEPEVAALAAARAELAQFDALKPKPLLTAFTIGETGREALPAAFKTRRLGEIKAQPGFLTILDPGDAVIPEPSGNAVASGRRTVLANWLADPKNPLTWRVIVNRVWQQHFGKGIAGTASDFGHLGEKPTHPELLDWLTANFLKNGQSLKWLHKQIVMSATYRQSARSLDSGKPVAKQHLESGIKNPAVVDPEDRLLWRFPPRRLDAEQARDAVLAATGELDEVNAGEGRDASKPVRAIYTKRIRNKQDDFLASLDQPAGFQSMPERQATTTATQSLLMINGDWVLDRAHALASRLLNEHPKNDTDLIAGAYRLLFSRGATSDEIKLASAFLKTQRAQLKKETPAPPPAATPLVDAASLFGPASKTTKAMMMHPGTTIEKLRVPLDGKIEGEQFCVEAVVLLKSLYPDAGVRTIVSRWNNGKTESGWSLGVTSEKSAHKPNNLIMQLSGEDFQGSQLYEPVPSGLRIPLDTPFYVAASIDPHPPEGHQFGSTITFYARDLSDPSAEVQTATAVSQVCGGWINDKRTLYVGGRDLDKKSLWDGAIARVALRDGVLDPGSLMAWAANAGPACVADISADQVPAMLKAEAARRWVWESSVVAPKARGGPFDPGKEAVADLCHALMNSNEFFYLQ